MSADQYGAIVTSQAREWPEITKIFASSDNFLNRMLRGGAANMTIDIYGYNLRTTTAIAEQIATIVRETPGSRDVRISQDIGRPELALKIDRFRATALGLTMDGITQSLSTLFQGGIATQYREEDDQYDVRLRLDEPQRRSIEDIRRSEITTPAGARIRLDSIAEIEERVGPVTIRRKNQERVVTVEFDAIDRPQGDLLADIRARTSREVLLPEGVSLAYSGLIEEQEKSERTMHMMIALGILLVYMVMAVQFESFRHPFIILLPPLRLQWRCATHHYRHAHEHDRLHRLHPAHRCGREQRRADRLHQHSGARGEGARDHRPQRQPAYASRADHHTDDAPACCRWHFRRRGFGDVASAGNRGRQRPHRLNARDAGDRSRDL